MAREFGPYASALIAAMGAMAGINRASDDRREQWLIPLAVLFERRRQYPIFLYLSIASSLLTVYTVVVLAFTLSALIAGNSGADESVKWLIGGSASVLSITAYGLLLGSIFESRTSAVVVGLSMYALPFLITLRHVLHTDTLPPGWFHRLLFLHVPPISQSASISILMQQLSYTAVTLLLLRCVSAKLIGRIR
jgi:hypothetical protein